MAGREMTATNTLVLSLILPHDQFPREMFLQNLRKEICTTDGKKDASQKQERTLGSRKYNVFESFLLEL